MGLKLKEKWEFFHFDLCMEPTHGTLAMTFCAFKDGDVFFFAMVSFDSYIDIPYTDRMRDATLKRTIY